MYEELARVKVRDAHRGAKDSLKLARDRSSRPLEPRLRDRVMTWMRASLKTLGAQAAARLPERTPREERTANAELQLAEK